MATLEQYKEEWQWLTVSELDQKNKKMLDRLNAYLRRRWAGLPAPPQPKDEGRTS